MKIRVTQEHMDKSVRRSGTDCMLATALKEQYPIPEGFYGLTVCANELGGYFGYSTVLSMGTFTSATFPMAIKSLPKIAIDRAREFDAGNPVEPFEFELPL